MDDKVFASANMTVAMSDDPTEYEAIPTVNVFDNDFKSIATTNAVRLAVMAGHADLAGGRWSSYRFLPAPICFWPVVRAAVADPNRFSTHPL